MSIINSQNIHFDEVLEQSELQLKFPRGNQNFDDAFFQLLLAEKAPYNRTTKFISAVSLPCWGESSLSLFDHVLISALSQHTSW